MPTSHCRYPDHHTGPGVGAPLGWIAALVIGGLIAANWHTVVVVLTVIAVLVALAVPVLLLWHNHGSAYDADLERQAAAEHAQQRHAAAYSITSASLPAVTPAERTAALDAVPAVHHHLHLHGVSAQEMADVARNAIEPPRL